MNQKLEKPSARGHAALAQKQTKRFAAFLSHYKAEAATEARLCQMELQKMLKHDIFLDSDDLQDLRTLKDDVRDSEVLLLLQSKDVLTRPWCLIELYTAVTNNVPIVALVRLLTLTL